MSGVYKDPGSPFWYYDIFVGGKRKRRSTKRTKKSEAEAVAREELKKALDREQFGHVPELTLREALFDHYLPSRKGKASYANLKRSCEYLCGDKPEVVGIGGDTPFHDVTGSILRKYRERREAQGKSPQTIDHEIKVVSATYTLIKEDYRVRHGIRWPIARPKGKARYLTEAEEKALLADLDPAREIVSKTGSYLLRPLAQKQTQRIDNHDLTVMLLDTGCRFGELAKLSWTMVDCTDFAWVHIYRSKVDNEARLQATARVSTILRRRYEARGNSRYVFPANHENGDEDLPRDTTKAIRRAMANVGINSPENIARFGRRDVRSLRDTFATKLRSRGRMSLDSIQVLLGHASIQMTQKYADVGVHVASEEAAALLDKLT